MKKSFKIVLIIVSVLLGIILLDTIQAIMFNNSPMIRITKTYSDFHKKNIGIFVETDIYEGVTQRTYFKWEKKNLPIKEDKDDLVDQLNEVNDMIIETFMNDNINYDNYCYNYVDTQRKVVVVGLENNTKEEQEWFKKNIVDSDLIEFEQGSKATTSNTTASDNLASNDKTNTTTKKTTTTSTKIKTSNQSTTKNKNETTTKKENVWDRLGLTEDQYFNQPMYSWEHVDFATLEECLAYGDKYEPYLKGEVSYNCSTVTSPSGKYLGEMFYT